MPIQPEPELLQALKKTKYIHYWDNGQWSLYNKDGASCQAYADKSEDGEWPEPLYEGDDNDFMGAGYASPLAIALASMAGIKVDSI